MRVSIVVDSQETGHLQKDDYINWRIDWEKVLDFYSGAFGKVTNAYYCTGGIHPTTKKCPQTAAQLKWFWNKLREQGWIVPDEDAKRKPDGKLNIDATVGLYLGKCLENTDFLVLFAGDGDYYTPLNSYLKAFKPIFCVGNPDKISNNLREIATVIDIKDLKSFIAEAEMEES